MAKEKVTHLAGNLLDQLKKIEAEFQSKRDTIIKAAEATASKEIESIVAQLSDYVISFPEAVAKSLKPLQKKLGGTVVPNPESGKKGRMTKVEISEKVAKLKENKGTRSRGEWAEILGVEPSQVGTIVKAHVAAGGKSETIGERGSAKIKIG